MQPANGVTINIFLPDIMDSVQQYKKGQVRGGNGGKQAESTDKVSEENHSKKDKRPFDKKAWREKKYSQKAKVDQWQAKRKLNMQRKYHKMLKKEGLNSTQNSAIGAGAVPKGTNVAKKTPGLGRKTSLDRASDVYREKLAAKNKQEDDLATQKKEREEAMSKYRENKAAKVFLFVVYYVISF